MTPEELELERKALAATQGRWQWFGNTTMREAYLATVDRGRVFVMDFARWGTSGAQPRFNVPLPESNDSIMRSIGELGGCGHPLGPRFEALHRRHFVGIGHPDAEHIAANNPESTLALLRRIRELEAQLEMERRR